MRFNWTPVAVAVVGLALVLTALRALDDPAGAIAGADPALRALREYGAWAWAAAMALICADLILPVPAGAVIAALGLIYGFGLGGLIGALGMVAAGGLAYALVRALGRPAALLLAGPERLRGLEGFFERSGAWAIVLSRGLPIIPEVIACLAGLASMRPARFLLALSLGSLPIGFVYAAIGVGWSERPVLALVIAYLVPILLLPLALALMRRR